MNELAGDYVRWQRGEISDKALFTRIAAKLEEIEEGHRRCRTMLMLALRHMMDDNRNSHRLKLELLVNNGGTTRRAKSDGEQVT